MRHNCSNISRNPWNENIIYLFSFFTCFRWKKTYKLRQLCNDRTYFGQRTFCKGWRSHSYRTQCQGKWKYLFSYQLSLCLSSVIFLYLVLSSLKKNAKCLSAHKKNWGTEQKNVRMLLKAYIKEKNIHLCKYFLVVNVYN